MKTAVKEVTIFSMTTNNAAQIDTSSQDYLNTIKEHFFCLKCNGQEMDATDGGLVCSNCGETYESRHHAIDALNKPSPSTQSELLGMALENNLTENQIQEFKIHKGPEPSGLSERMKQTESDPNNYYLQTKMNFDQALKEIGNFENKRVLEIGSCFDYYFLDAFKEKGCECFAVNIHFKMSNKPEFDFWPHKIVADMNDLPFKDGVFDIVVISATSHHSNTPEILCDQIARVLKPGGHCLMINDPTWGIIKNLGGPDNTQAFRESHINENEYPIWRYNKMFKNSGFKTTQLFSDFYDHKLQNKEIHPGTRFAFVAKIVKRCWASRLFRNIFKKYLLWFAQAIMGFPMNAVLKKK